MMHLMFESCSLYSGTLGLPKSSNSMFLGLRQLFVLKFGDKLIRLVERKLFLYYLSYMDVDLLRNIG
jgi:hypothetical protein